MDSVGKWYLPTGEREGKGKGVRAKGAKGAKRRREVAGL